MKNLRALLPLFFAIVLGAQVLFPASASPSESPAAPAAITAVGFDQRLGERAPLGDIFEDAHGNPISLRSAFGGKPVILSLVYYKCPNLCTWMLNGLVDALHRIPIKLGQGYRVVTVSIDPRENPAQALARKRTYLARYGISEVSDPRAAASWRFLTGSGEAIDRLARSVGFHYRYDPVSGQYSHPTGIVVLTSTGEVSGYFFGVHFDPKLLGRSLGLAAKGRHSSLTQQVLLLCSNYKPGRIGQWVLRLIQISWLATVGALGICLGWLTVKAKKESRA